MASGSCSPSGLRKRNLHQHRGLRHDPRFAINDDGLGVRRTLVDGWRKSCGAGMLAVDFSPADKTAVYDKIDAGAKGSCLAGEEDRWPTISSTVAMRPIGVSASNCLTCSATSGRRFIRSPCSPADGIFTRARAAPLHGRDFSSKMNHRTSRRCSAPGKPTMYRSGHRREC